MDAGPWGGGRSWPALEDVEFLTAHFEGDISDIPDARLAASQSLDTLICRDPPTSPISHGDILVVVTELGANAVQYAPGPFTLRLRRTFDGVHVTVADTNPTPPTPRRCDPARGAGGIGWHLIQALADQVDVVRKPDGKDIHAFLPW